MKHRQSTESVPPPADVSVVLVAGRVRRRFYRAGGATASRTELVADRVVPARQRARSRALVEQVRRQLDATLEGAAW